MTELNSEAHIAIPSPADYIERIADRLFSFDAVVTGDGNAMSFRFPFGRASFDLSADALIVRLSAANPDRLARLKDILATSIELHAKRARPQIVWQGDLAGDKRLAQFREMRVTGIRDLTPHMRRIRLAGDNLARFAEFDGMHVRLLFPTPQVPQPLWPEAGPNGLAVWPAEDRRAPARVYTIRRLDVAEGFMEIDFVMHGDESIGSSWAASARPGSVVGIMGPLGRPVRPASWYILGADETGLPALGRILENLPADTKGHAFVEVDNAEEEQIIAHPPGLELRWIHRNRKAPGEDHRLAETICAVARPANTKCFSWFAAEAEAAKRVREHWRVKQALGRDETLAAAYWRRGALGPMAG
jgi:NADPH-dependent ferric siderophore reductase